MKFHLKQNYPNPFNSSTTIFYTLVRSGIVKRYIYNLTGQLIRTFVNDYQDSGEYSVDFAAQGIPAGIYFYQLEMDTQKSAIKKMIYNKENFPKPN